MIAAVVWPIWERIRIAGDFAVSPHGISIAAGVLLGAGVTLRRARLRGMGRPASPPEPGGAGTAAKHVSIDEAFQAFFTAAVVGGILGARIMFIVTRLDQFPDPLGWFRIWEGGLSLIGGVAGAVLAGLPYIYRHRLSTRLVLDSVAPGLALGIAVGRIGDLVIGEHLGGRTDFLLGWRCSGAVGDPSAPYPWPGATAQGCFDTAVHQTALYDSLIAGLVFAVLLWFERKPRFDGFFVSAFVILYGAGRVLTGFARDADLDLIGTLTGSQVTSILAIATVLVWLASARPWERRNWAWSPPHPQHEVRADEAGGQG